MKTSKTKTKDLYASALSAWCSTLAKLGALLFGKPDELTDGEKKLIDFLVGEGVKAWVKSHTC